MSDEEFIDICECNGLTIRKDSFTNSIAGVYDGYILCIKIVGYKLTIYNTFISIPNMRCNLSVRDALICEDEDFEKELKLVINHYNKYIKPMNKIVETELKKKVIEGDFI